MPIDEQSIFDANAKFAETYEEVKVHCSKPRKKLAIVTCMDAWIHASAFDIQLGDAHIIRNAGASAGDALRSLIASQQMLGTEDIMLVKHTKCGMVGLTNERVDGSVRESLNVSSRHIDFLPIVDLKQSVIDDVEWLKGNKHLKQNTTIYGYILNIENGKLEKVV